MNAIAIVDTLSTIGEEVRRTQHGAAERTIKEGQMDRRMLAIGVAIVAFGATACGDSNDASDRAIQAPEIEVEATAEAAPNNGTLEGGVQTEGTDRSDAAQGRASEEGATDRTDAAQIQRTELP